MISIGICFRAALFATAAFACASGAAGAPDTQAAWEGFMVNTGSLGCSGVGGTAVGDTHVSVYRPHIPLVDTSLTFLSVVFLRAAFTLENVSETANPQMTGSGADTTWVIDGRGAAGAFKGNAYSTFVVKPTPVSLSTTNITITGTIHSYFNVPGCIVTFSAEYVKE
jgi:hypothetical protein